MSGSLTSNEIEDVVSSVRRLVSTDQRPRSRDPGADKLLLTPSLRVVPEEAARAAPLILTGSDLAPDSPEDRETAVEAEWEEPIWTAPEPPLAELALGAELDELVAEAPMWPEAGEDGWTDDAMDPAPEASGPVVPFPRAAAPVDPAPQAEDDVDVAEVLTAAMLEDEGVRVMDEAELHALVREIVRHELQGSLGERITRNVRKLVRAEVNRALAARALD